MTTIRFNNGVTGGTLTDINDTPIYHDRDFAVFAPPSVQSITGTYTNAKTVRVIGSGEWDGDDIVVVRNITDRAFDVWFGSPASGTRVSYDIDASGFADLMNDDPVSGYRFIPEQAFVVGNYMIVCCSTYVTADSRQSRISILYASMSDLEAGTSDPWTIAFVTNEYDTVANNVGSVWCMTDPVEYEGRHWAIIADYDSDAKEGGQAWILEIASGIPNGMVRLHTRSGGTNEHWHNGCIIYDGSSYKAIMQVSDTERYIMYREISSLLNYAANATVDTSSGISGSYRVSNASLTDWSAVGIASGYDVPTSLTNSRGKNMFVLGQDPLDDSKFMTGGDISAGLIDRCSLDSNDILVVDTAFSALSRHVRAKPNESTQQFSVFKWSQNGNSIAAIVSNEIDESTNVKEFSGVIHSTDGGVTWGWVWKGSTSLGLDQLNGVAMLSDGTIVVGSSDTSTSLRVITPGTQIKGQPLFVGTRPTNFLGNATDQSILASGTGMLTSSGTSPEQDAPLGMSVDEFFDLAYVEANNGGALRLVQAALDETDVTSGSLAITFWSRRKTPSSTDEADRLANDIVCNFALPGATMPSVAWSSSPASFTGDYARTTTILDGTGVTGTFNADPSDLRTFIRGQGLGKSESNTEMFFEAVTVGVDRPPGIYGSRTDSGVASAKFTSLGLGTSWTVLAVLQIPDECWDAWAGNHSDTWSSAAPVLSISNSGDTANVTFQAMMNSTAEGGVGVSFSSADFDWEIVDSDSATATEVDDHPARNVPVLVALSKDGTGALQYAIGTPGGVISGTRSMSSSIDADTLRFSDVSETDALEMYIHKIEYDSTARSSSVLETIVEDAAFPSASAGGATIKQAPVVQAVISRKKRNQ